MAYLYLNRVAFHAANVPGIGVIAVGASIAGFRTAAAAGAVAGDQFPYGAGDDTGPSWEVGDMTVNSDGTLTRTVIESSNGNAPVPFSANVIITCCPHGQQLAGFGLARNIKAGFLVTGGGTLSDDGANVKWTTQFVVSGGGVGSDFATGGLFEIPPLSNGTVVTGVAGATNATAGASGVTLLAYEALYYILPIGATGAPLQANFRMVGIATAFDVPDNWLMIATRNIDDGSVRWCTGVIVPNSQSVVSSGAHGTTAGTALTTVKRDASGNIRANSLHGAGAASAITPSAAGDLITRLTSDASGMGALVLAESGGADLFSIYFVPGSGGIVIGDANLNTLLIIGTNPSDMGATANYFETLPSTAAAILAMPSPSTGTRRFATGATSATFGAALVAGGSNNVPVNYSGTGWKIG